MYLDMFSVATLAGLPTTPDYDTDEDMEAMWNDDITSLLSELYQNLTIHQVFLEVAHVDQVTYEPVHSSAAYKIQYKAMRNQVGELRCLLQHHMHRNGISSHLSPPIDDSAVPSHLRHVRRDHSQVAGDMRDYIMMRTVTEYLRFTFSLLNYVIS